MADMHGIVLLSHCKVNTITIDINTRVIDNIENRIIGD